MHQCINLYPQRVTYTKKKRKKKRIGKVKTKRYISKTHHERNQTDNDDS